MESGPARRAESGENDELETIALGPPPQRRPRRRATIVVAVVALVVLVIAGGALAFVTTEHHAPPRAAPTPPLTQPSFNAPSLGISDGRFAVVDDGHLAFVDAHNGAIDTAGAPAGDVAIAAVNGPSLIAVAMRHWYLVEPGRAAVPLPPGNVFARQTGGWWIAQGDHVSVLGDPAPPIRLPARTTAIADTSVGLVLQNNTDNHVSVWNPAGRNSPRAIVNADAEILAVGGNQIVWRPADNGTAEVRVVDVVHGRSITITRPDLTSGVDASVAPDGKHVAFYDRSGGGTVALFDIANGAVLFDFDSRAFGTFSPFTAVPGPTGYQPLPFTWTPDGRKIIVLGTLYPVPRITAMDTQDGIAITTASTFALDQVAALDAPSTS
jgi:hypothetical protein